MIDQEEHSGRQPCGEDAETLADPSADTVAEEPRNDPDPHGAPGLEQSSSGYDMGDPLGEGGMAIVYQATDQNLGRTVAVKCLRDDLAWRADVRERFFDEARILGSLGHPGAIPIHRAGRMPDGRLYYSMKKVGGHTLQAMLDARKPEQIRNRQKLLELVDLFARVCETMAAAHAERVIHRDIKPDNIMVDDFGAVYVMDWGLAKRLDDVESHSETRKTRLGAVMGTPAYMSPEQASGESLHADTQSDVFSLGVVLYEILTGVNPFGASSGQHAMKGVMYHNPDEPRAANPIVGRALSAVCMKALAKDPYKRYGDAKELLDDIRRFRQFVPVLATKPRWIDRAYYWSRRRPVVAAVLATVASISLIVGLGLGLQTHLDRLAQKEAYEELNEALKEVDDLEVQLGEVKSRLTDPSLNDRQRRVLVARSQVLKALIEIEQGAVIGTARAIDTLIDDSGRAEDLGHDDYVKLVRSTIEQQEWIGAYALISYGLTQAREEDDYPLTPDEIVELERLRKIARAEIEKAGLTPGLEDLRALDSKGAE